MNSQSLIKKIFLIDNAPVARLSFLLIAAVLFLGGCKESTENLGQSDNDEHDSVHAWIWVYDSTNSKIRAYKFVGTTGTSTPALEEDAKAHANMHIMTAGGIDGDNPAIWMAGSDNKAYAFTTGFHAHVDHLHQEVPEKLSYSPKTSGLNNPVHMGYNPDKTKVIFANDGDSTLAIINTADGTVTTSDKGSTHSVALLTDSWLITTDKGSGTAADAWLRIVDIASPNATKYEYNNFCTFIHGDAYYHTNKTTFVACNEGIKYLDFTNAATSQPTDNAAIAYPSGINRVNFLYHGGSNRIAFAPHKPTSGDTSDSLVLLNMQNKTMEKITISGAALRWNIENGNYALSENGKALAYSDTSQKLVYHINMDPDSADYKKVTTLTAPDINAAVAISYDGSHIWTLTGTDPKTVSHIHVEDGNIEGTFPVHVNSSWIYVTSADPTKSVVED